MAITIRPEFVLKILLITIFILLCLNIVGLFIKYNVDLDIPKTLRLVDFDQEANFPSFYSALALFFSSVLLFMIAGFNKQVKSNYKSWLWLGIIFLFLAFDEAASVHEILVGVLKHMFNFSGYFYYAWIVPYGIGLVILTGIYVPFLNGLPKKIKILFLVSGIIFVTGAIGFEMLGGKAVEAYGPYELYAFFYTCEELLEMVGIALFIYALLLHITESLNFSIKFHR